MELYKRKDYDFLSLTDHWVLSEEEERDGLLMLPGCEYDVGGSAQEGIFHIVGVGMKETPPLVKGSALTPQAIICLLYTSRRHNNGGISDCSSTAPGRWS